MEEKNNWAGAYGGDVHFDAISVDGGVFNGLHELVLQLECEEKGWPAWISM